MSREEALVPNGVCRASVTDMVTSKTGVSFTNLREAELSIFRAPRQSFSIKIKVAAQNMTNGLQYLLASCVFWKVAAAAGTENGLGIERFFMHRQNKHWQSGANLYDRLDQIYAALVGKT